MACKFHLARIYLNSLCYLLWFSLFLIHKKNWKKKCWKITRRKKDIDIFTRNKKVVKACGFETSGFVERFRFPSDTSSAHQTLEESGILWLLDWHLDATWDVNKPSTKLSFSIEIYLKDWMKTRTQKDEEYSPLLVGCEVYEQKFRS